MLLETTVRGFAEHAAELRRDLRYGWRMLANTPGFSAVALLSLSLGLCIAACAYSEMHGLILRDIPEVANPDELAAVQMPISYPLYRRYRERIDLFSSTAAYIAPTPFTISFNGHTERIWGHLVTPSYFYVLGARPARGRFFESEEQQQRESPQIVASWRFWRDHLGGDSAVAGKKLRVNGQLCTIIGVGEKISWASRRHCLRPIFGCRFRRANTLLRSWPAMRWNGAI